MSVEKNEVNPGATPEVSVELLSSHDVARRLGISPDRTRKLLKRGILPGVQIGKKWMVPRRDLEAYISRLFTSINRAQT